MLGLVVPRKAVPPPAAKLQLSETTTPGGRRGVSWAPCPSSHGAGADPARSGHTGGASPCPPFAGGTRPPSARQWERDRTRLPPRAGGTHRSRLSGAWVGDGSAEREAAAVGAGLQRGHPLSGSLPCASSPAGGRLPAGRWRWRRVSAVTALQWPGRGPGRAESAGARDLLPCRREAAE